MKYHHTRFDRISDIQYLAQKSDPYWEDPEPVDFRPTFEPTGDLRRDLLTILRSKRFDTIVRIASALGTYDKKVSDAIREMVVAGTIGLAEVYACLPALKYKHQSMLAVGIRPQARGASQTKP